ncbi:MAG: class I poly(R)-hydroxyalkanoic acid synthase [Alphaproteobacteria bacterium]|nr:class I poly(R)-hydroxyalkanoic acid synthase [Alphaproteobacteria bacterium]
MAKASEIWQKITQQLMMHHSMKPALGHTDPRSFAESMLHMSRSVSMDPVHLVEAQMGLVADHMNLVKYTTEKLFGETNVKPLVTESPRDRRFRDAAWQDSTVFDYIKQSYLINARWLQDTVGQVKGLDRHTAHKLNFFTRQFIDAMSPSNYAITNPEVMRTTIESNGDNVVKGLGKLLEDLEAGDGKLRIRMSDENAFTFGKDIAATPGHVVFQNDLMQLIQYKPTTKQVYETPILITPAWINKYYILDLRPENSLIGWLVNQGHTVFVISWVNPDEQLGRKRFDDYLLEGPLAALNVVESTTGSKKTSLVGYCLGGTLTAITLAYLRAKNQMSRVASATYLTTMVDFTEAGDMLVFIDDMQLDSLEERMSEQGFLDAADMAATFNMLRSNDLIWSFVVNNYLLGKDPFPFDLLYWNSDSTRMPATMHAFYLRNMYQDNKLVQPNGITLADTPINISKITTPSYVLATKDDHIAPWICTYAATQIYDGPITFTLADSGHIAGVVNPPSKKKYCWWQNSKLPPKSADWLKDAKHHEGSWWGNWNEWLKNYAGKKVKPPTMGNKKYKPIEKAPGAYAKVRT